MVEPMYSNTRSRAAADADLRDHRENNVLRGDARLQRAFHANRVGLRRRLQQALRGEHMPHLAGADAERQRAERSVRRRVAVAADDGHAGLREALLRTDHVDDALLGAVQIVQADAEIGAVLFHLRELRRADLSMIGSIGQESRDVVGVL